MMRDGRRFLLSLLVLPFLLSSGVMLAAEGNGNQAGFCERQKPCQLLSQSDAERILGLPVRPGQSTSELKGDVRQCMCAYTGITKDIASGQDVNLFFLLEQKEENPSAEQARQVLESIRQANAHDSFIQELTGMGDEAFLLSSGANSHLIMARKGGIIMRLQIKKAAKKTALDELKTFAEKVFKP
jgi:hypothetical protein